MKPEMLVTGVVLAGGRSSRFGSDKAMYHWKGETFLAHAVKLLKPLCAEVMISGAKQEYATEGCLLLADEYLDCGPLSGIHAALNASRTEYVLFLTCDMPLMGEPPLLLILKELSSEISGESAPLVVSWQQRESGGGVFPLLVSVTLAGKVTDALKNGNYSIRRSLLEGERVRMLDIPDEWELLFANMNYPPDPL